jgi:hypothetical protein
LAFPNFEGHGAHICSAAGIQPDHRHAPAGI